MRERWALVEFEDGAGRIVRSLDDDAFREAVDDALDFGVKQLLFTPRDFNLFVRLAHGEIRCDWGKESRLTYFTAFGPVNVNVFLTRRRAFSE